MLEGFGALDVVRYIGEEDEPGKKEDGARGLPKQKYEEILWVVDEADALVEGPLSESRLDKRKHGIYIKP